MTCRLLVVAFLGTLSVCHAGGRVKDAKDKFAELEGSWTIVKMEIDGRSLLEKDEKWKLIIKNGKLSSDARKARKDSVDLSKILDPAKKPKTVTAAYEGAITFVGIYEVKGDELRVCGDAVDTATETTPEARRPKKFDSKEGLLLVFKREKK